MAAAPLVLAAALAWAGVLAWIDWRRQRVPNVLLLPVLLLSLACLVWRGSGPLAAGTGASLAGALTGFLLLPGYLAGKLGAGDVKLVFTLGLLQGWPAIAGTLLLAALLLGAASLWLVMQMGFAQARSLRLPAAAALCGGFAGSALIAAFA